MVTPVCLKYTEAILKWQANLKEVFFIKLLETDGKSCYSENGTYRKPHIHALYGDNEAVVGKERFIMDKKAMYKLSYGLFVLTSAFEGKDNGCIINTGIQVTSEPNRVSIAVNKANFTEEMIKQSGKFNLSILSEEAVFDTFRHFGFQSGRDVDKFAAYSECRRSANGLYFVTAGTNAYISASVEQTIDLGSHTLFIAGVDDMEVLSDAASATYAYYQSEIKPKPDRQPAAGKTAWRCRVCGYIYEGEELPADFVCPLCKHPASDFEKITI